MKKILIALLLVACMLMTAAGAETVSFNGTVKASETVPVYAPVGGMVASVPVETGSKVTADTVIAELKTSKVYATEDGVVTAVFGQPGDSADTVASRYGALIYLENGVNYTISASTANAYKATENQYVHVGESVYIQSRTTSSHTGTGLVTAVSGTSFTVEVESGEFLLNESADVFRSPDYASTSRIGRGNIARKDPSVVTASGSIVSYAVKAGDHVKRGDLLLETLDGTFDGFYMSGTSLLAENDGIISKLNLTAGSSIQKNSVIAEIAVKNEVRVEVSIAETDLCYVKTGDPVIVELNWNQDEDISYPGTISAISCVANEGGENITYTMYVDFKPDESTRLGMSAIVTTMEEEPLDNEEGIEQE